MISTAASPEDNSHTLCSGDEAAVEFDDPYRSASCGSAPDRVLAEAGRPVDRRGLRRGARGSGPDPPALAGAEPAADRAGDPPADRHPAGAVPWRRRGDDPSVPDDLEARGWVTWTEDQQATLTELGAAAHADLLEKVSQRRARLSAGISPQEYTATIEVLRRMAVNLGWAESS